MHTLGAYVVMGVMNQLRLIKADLVSDSNTKQYADSREMDTSPQTDVSYLVKYRFIRCVREWTWRNDYNDFHLMFLLEY